MTSNACDADLDTVFLYDEDANDRAVPIYLEAAIGGERLDVFLALHIPGLTRSAAQRLIGSGKVTFGDALNQKRLSKNHMTKAGDVYSIIQDIPEEPIALPENIPLCVVFEDSDVIVVNKPRGMVVHPAPGHTSGTLVNALLYHCGQSLSGIGGIRRPGIVHRIDKDTSGLLIAAKNDRAHLALARQLSERTLTREYEAVLRGTLKNDSGTVDAPIGRHHSDRKRQAVTPDNSRNAVTHYEVITRYAGYTHVRCRLKTGRTHQIRVHMAHIGHPVLGDMVYGMKKPELGISCQCLHAKRLRFLHPSSNENIELCADLPEYFENILEKLKKMT